MDSTVSGSLTNGKSTEKNNDPLEGYQPSKRVAEKIFTWHEN